MLKGHKHRRRKEDDGGEDTRNSVIELPVLHVFLAFNGQSWSFWSERGSKRSSIYIYTRVKRLLTIPRFSSGSPTAMHAAVSPSTRSLIHRRRRGLKSSHQTPFSSIGSHREGSHSFAYLISRRCVSIYMLKCSQCEPKVKTWLFLR